MYTVMAADALIGIGYLLHTQGVHNYTVLILLVCILVYGAVEAVVYSFYEFDKQFPVEVMNGIVVAVEGLIHWVITQAYLRVAYETKFLLDRRVIFNDPAKLAEVYRFKRNLKVANVVCPLLVLACAVIAALGLNAVGKLYYIGEYGFIGLISIFTLVWGWTLYRLYRNTRDSKLLPKKWVFILHGSLMVLYLLFEAFALQSYPRAEHRTTLKGIYDWYALYELSLFLLNLIEALTLLLVLMLMLPVGENQKMKRKELQKFLFVGFLDRRQLENAIRTQYPDLSQEQIGFIRNDLDDMEELMSKTSCDITAGMVSTSYEDQQQMAFHGWMQIRIQRAREWDVVPKNPHMLTEEESDD